MFPFTKPGVLSVVEGPQWAAHLYVPRVPAQLYNAKTSKLQSLITIQALLPIVVAPPTPYYPH